MCSASNFGESGGALSPLTDLRNGRFSMNEIEELRSSFLELPLAAFAPHGGFGKLCVLAEGGRSFAQY